VQSLESNRGYYRKGRKNGCRIYGRGGDFTYRDYSDGGGGEFRKLYLGGGRGGHRDKKVK